MAGREVRGAGPAQRRIAVGALPLPGFTGCASVPEGAELRIDARGHDQAKLQENVRNCKLFARDVSPGPGPNWGKVLLRFRVTANRVKVSADVAEISTEADDSSTSF
jgi:hypothetical protein